MKPFLPAICSCLLLLLGLTTGLASPDADADPAPPATKVELVASEFGDKNQTLLLTDAKTGAPLLKLHLDCPSLGTRIDPDDETTVLWNTKRNALVLLTHHRDTPRETFAAVVQLPDARTTSTCYFADSHPNGFKGLRFEWVAEDELKASYLPATGKLWVERWTIEGGRFHVAPLVIDGEPTTDR